METLNKLVVVMLDIHLWTARKKLRAEDLKAAGELPPETLASLGSKRVCDPKKLAPFAALKKRAHRVCELVGVRFLGGYAIPEEKLFEVINDLKEIEAEAARAKAAFLADYQNTVDQWVATNAAWGEIILRAVEPASRVAAQISFGHQAFRIGAAAAEDGAESNDGLSEAVAGLGDRLIFEISRDAQALWDTSLQGKNEVTQRATRPLKTILKKLEGLAFIDTRINSLILRIREGLKALPKSGIIAGQDLNLLAGLVLQLADRKGLLSGSFDQVTETPEEQDQEPDDLFSSHEDSSTLDEEVEKGPEDIEVIPEPMPYQEFVLF